MAADGAPDSPRPDPYRVPGEGRTHPEEITSPLPVADRAHDPVAMRRPAFTPRENRSATSRHPGRPRSRVAALFAPLRSRRRWFAAGSAGILAGALGIAVAVQSSQAADCALAVDQDLRVAKVAQHEAPAAAAPISTDQQSGKATFYGPASPGGNCSYPRPPADKLTAAAGPAQYAAAGGCGGYVDITGARGTVRVKIDNQCPECEKGHFDLSDEAFAKIDDPTKGIVPITYRAVRNPSLSTTLSFRVKEGSSQWWFALLVDGAGNPLEKVEVSSDGSSWTSLQRTDYNYWLASSGAGKGPFRVRVADVYGQSATVSGITLSPTEVQKTSARLYANGTQPSSDAGTAPSSGTGQGTPTAGATSIPTATPTRTAAAMPTASSGSSTPSSTRTGPPTRTGRPVPTARVGHVPVLSAPAPAPDRCARHRWNRS